MRPPLIAVHSLVFCFLVLCLTVPLHAARPASRLTLYYFPFDAESYAAVQIRDHPLGDLTDEKEASALLQLLSDSGEPTNFRDKVVRLVVVIDGGREILVDGAGDVSADGNTFKLSALSFKRLQAMMGRFACELVRRDKTGNDLRSQLLLYDCPETTLHSSEPGPLAAVYYVPFHDVITDHPITERNIGDIGYIGNLRYAGNRTSAKQGSALLRLLNDSGEPAHFDGDSLRLAVVTDDGGEILVDIHGDVSTGDKTFKLSAENCKKLQATMDQLARQWLRKQQELERYRSRGLTRCRRC